jgi:hypothetical protein
MVGALALDQQRHYCTSTIHPTPHPPPGVSVVDIGLENAGQYLGATYGAGVVIIWVC